jgi:hypothetical protein
LTGSVFAVHAAMKTGNQRSCIAMIVLLIVKLRV